MVVAAAAAALNKVVHVILIIISYGTTYQSILRVMHITTTDLVCIIRDWAHKFRNRRF